MTQEVQVILTLEVDATKSKEEIKAFFKDMEETYTRSVSQRNRFEFPKVTLVDVKEEAEIYGTEKPCDECVTALDEAMKSAARDILQELPEDYWDVIGKHLPKYHSRDEVLWSDQMQKVVDDEMDDEKDLERYLSEWGREVSSKHGVELSLRILDMALYLEAVDNRERKQLETDTLFLQEALNDLSYRNNRNDKGMNLLCDWLRVLKDKSGYFDNEFFVKRFKEVVGEEMWDQEGYERFLEQQK